jgi:hypothetical protein
MTWSGGYRPVRRLHVGDPPPDIKSIRKDVRGVEIDDLVGFDAVLHLAAVCNERLDENAAVRSPPTSSSGVASASEPRQVISGILQHAECDR